jgi:chromosome segregation ATPase
MKPKAPTEHEDGLLEYLEDVIGTSNYKEDIDQAFKLMEEYQEERQIKLNRLKFVEKEKAALESQKKEAEDYLRLRNEHIKAQSRYWQWILWKCFQAEASFESQLVRSRHLQNPLRSECTFFRRSTKRSLLRRRRKTKTISRISKCSGSIIMNVKRLIR